MVDIRSGVLPLQGGLTPAPLSCSKDKQPVAIATIAIDYGPSAIGLDFELFL